MYRIMCAGDDDIEYTNIIFKTIEDTEFFLRLNGENPDCFVIVEVPVFSKKFWYNLNPYVSWFNEKGEMTYVKQALPRYVFGMMESQFAITPGRCNKHVMVAFWDATKDIDQATILAKSLYEGWKAAQNA